MVWAPEPVLVRITRKALPAQGAVLLQAVVQVDQ